MNNLKASMKKLLGNKNTVTILGILLCLVILAIGAFGIKKFVVKKNKE